MFKGILKSQLLRFDRICSKQVDKDGAVKILFQALRQRGYTRFFLCKIPKDIIKESTGTIPTPQEKCQIIPLISTYSKYTQQINHEL